MCPDTITTPAVYNIRATVEIKIDTRHARVHNVRTHISHTIILAQPARVVIDVHWNFIIYSHHSHTLTHERICDYLRTAKRDKVFKTSECIPR